MDSLVSFSKWLSKWFTVAVILWAAFNYALPATSSWVIPNTAYLLGLILFGMGLTLTTEDFKRIIAFRDQPPHGGPSGMPCGACREFLMELHPDNRNLEFMVDYETRQTITLGELLPLWWGEERAQQFEEKSQDKA